MISRKDRIAAAGLYSAFLNGHLDASCLEVWQRVYESSDATIRHACEILADYDEDFEDDLHLMEKHEWDYLERVRLVLLSNAHLDRKTKCVLGARRILVAASLVCFASFVVVTGPGWHLLVGTSMLGIAVLCYGLIHSAWASEGNKEKQILEPFISAQQLNAIRRSTTDFQKSKFPPEWNDDSEFWDQFSLIINSFWIVVCGIFMLVFSPLVLLVLALPEREGKFVVRAEQ